MGFNSAFKGLNLMFEDYLEVCQENSRCVKIRQELRVLYTNTYTHF